MAADVLSRVEASDEQSLAELRRLLALLRAAVPAGAAGAGAPAVPDRRPLPGLAELPGLVAGFRAAGLPVDLEITGAGPALDEGVGLSVYRIVEEALTNAVRHARAECAAVLRRGWLHLEVVDEGTGPLGGDPGGGHGAAGMRERALLLDGELAAGPGPDGGFRVAALLPLRTDG